MAFERSNAPRSKLVAQVESRLLKRKKKLYLPRVWAKAAAIPMKIKSLKSSAKKKTRVGTSPARALFVGADGAAKLAAAQKLAAAAGLGLYRVDLSTVVSKYIGETEKNLDRIFAAAARKNSLLFFDEADALFDKRTDVKDSHDRYANQEVSYLLQRMEEFNGAAIIALNRKGPLRKVWSKKFLKVVRFPR